MDTVPVGILWELENLSILQRKQRNAWQQKHIWINSPFLPFNDDRKVTNHNFSHIILSTVTNIWKYQRQEQKILDCY